MQINLKQLIGMVVAAALIASMAWLAGASAESARLLRFWVHDFPVFAMMVPGILLIALSVVYISQFIRNQVWYDRNGAAREMGTLQKRIGTQKEKPYDGIAMAIQYSGTTLLIGLVAHAIFSIHG